MERRGHPINAPATPTPKSFLLAQEIDRLNAEAARIESRADQNARGSSASSEKLEELLAVASDISIDVPLPPGFGDVGTFTNGINDAGAVTGYYVLFQFWAGRMYIPGPNEGYVRDTEGNFATFARRAAFQAGLLASTQGATSQGFTWTRTTSSTASCAGPGERSIVRSAGEHRNIR